MQFFRGGRAYIEQILHWQRVNDFLVVILLDLGDGIRFFVVAAQFGCNFVVGYTDAGRDPQLELDPIADLSGDGHRGTI